MIEPDWYPGNRQLRQFAGAALPGMGLLAYLIYRLSGSEFIGWGIAVFGVVVFASGLLRPPAVRPIYLLVMVLALPIGWLISVLLMRLVFYAVVTPLALCLRVTRRDPLQLRKPEAASYWRAHPQRSDPASYFRQS